MLEFPPSVAEGSHSQRRSMSDMAMSRRLRDNAVSAGAQSPMRIFVSMAVLLTLCTFPLLSQESKPLTLKGVVVRQDGTGLRAAHVFVRDYQAGTQWEMYTEADGGFSFVVDPGCYDIFNFTGGISSFFPENMCSGRKQSHFQTSAACRPSSPIAYRLTVRGE
jgi:hypothetical protein